MTSRRWPLWLRRLVCRHFGHRPVRLAKHLRGERRHRAQVGTGCLRCDLGSVKTYRRVQYPLPREATLALTDRPVELQ